MVLTTVLKYIAENLKAQVVSSFHLFVVLFLFQADIYFVTVRSSASTRKSRSGHSSFYGFVLASIRVSNLSTLPKSSASTRRSRSGHSSFLWFCPRVRAGI